MPAVGPTSILVLANPGLGYSRGIHGGIVAQAGLDVQLFTAVLEEWPAYRDKDLLGVIAHCSNASAAAPMMDAFASRGIPVVNTSFVSPIALPRVGVDDGMVGRLAAEHLVERGFRRLAVIGLAGHRYSDQRCLGFAAAADRLGIPWHSRHPLGAGSAAVPTSLPEDAEWAMRLPRPLGLFVASDVYAHRLVNHLSRAGVPVPAEIAVLGCDDDEHLCVQARPQLSSVRLDLHRVGAEAYRLLERLAAGEAPPAEPILIPPLGITSRASTSPGTVLDPQIAAAIAFIRSKLQRKIQVSDIAAAAHVSRSTLERRFRDVLGRSPREEIARHRMDLAQELLLAGETPLLEVARRCGFTHASYFAEVFQERFRCTPSEFRRLHRQPGPGRA